MENEYKIDKIELLDLFPNKSDINPIINSFKNNRHKNNFLSKNQKKYHKANKYYSNDHRKFLKNKRKWHTYTNAPDTPQHRSIPFPYTPRI